MWEPLVSSSNPVNRCPQIVVMPDEVESIARAEFSWPDRKPSLKDRRHQRWRAFIVVQRCWRYRQRGRRPWPWHRQRGCRSGSWCDAQVAGSNRPRPMLPALRQRIGPHRQRCRTRRARYPRRCWLSGPGGREIKPSRMVRLWVKAWRVSTSLAPSSGYSPRRQPQKSRPACVRYQSVSPKLAPWSSREPIVGLGGRTPQKLSCTVAPGWRLRNCRQDSTPPGGHPSLAASPENRVPGNCRHPQNGKLSPETKLSCAIRTSICADSGRSWNAIAYEWGQVPKLLRPGGNV